MRPEWVSFPDRKPADGCKFLTKILQMGHNFDIILPGNGLFSSKLNKTYCSLVNFYCKQSENGSVFCPALVCGWVNFPILWPHPPVQMKLKCPPPDLNIAIPILEKQGDFNRFPLISMPPPPGICLHILNNIKRNGSVLILKA